MSKEIPMQCAINSRRLLQALRDGAELKQRTVYARWTSKKRHVAHLHYPDGTRVRVQVSAIKPLLKNGLLQSQLWSGGHYTFALTGRGRQ